MQLRNLQRKLQTVETDESGERLNLEVEYQRNLPHVPMHLDAPYQNIYPEPIHIPEGEPHINVHPLPPRPIQPPLNIDPFVLSTEPEYRPPIQEIGPDTTAIHTSVPVFTSVYPLPHGPPRMYPNPEENVVQPLAPLPTVSEPHIVQRPIAGPSALPISEIPFMEPLTGQQMPGSPGIPREVQTVLEHIGRVSKESQTDSINKTLDDINALIKKYPELRNVIVNALMGEIIKNRNYSKQDIEKIREMYKEDKPYVLKKYDYQRGPKITYMKKMTKPKTIYDFEGFTPPNSVIIRF